MMIIKKNMINHIEEVCEKLMNAGYQGIVVNKSTVEPKNS